MLSTADLESRLDALYSQLEVIRSDSPVSDLETFASFFSQDCVVNLESMREIKEPALGRQGVVAKLQETTKHLYLEKRKVVSQAISEKDMRVFSEMRNRYNVHTQELDDFPEILVATFNDEGLINSFRHYSCRSPIVGLIQSATGEGPYNEEEMKQ
jgi:hypothetical protein